MSNRRFRFRRPVFSDVRVAAVCLFICAVTPQAIAEPRSLAARSSEFTFVPGTNGFVSCWLQLGPLESPRWVRGVPGALANRAWIDLAAPVQPKVAQSDRLSAIKGFGIRDGQMAAGHQWRTRLERTEMVAFNGKKPATVYLAAVVESERAQRVYLSLGTDGGREVWLNQRRVFYRDREARAARDTDLVPLDLPAGQSVIALRLWKSRKGPWRLYARFLNRFLDRLDDVVFRLPGHPVSTGRQLERTGRLVLSRKLDLDAGAVDVRAGLIFNGGRPIGPKTVVRVAWGDRNRGDGEQTFIDLGPLSPASFWLAKTRFHREHTPLMVHANLGRAAFDVRMAMFMRDVKDLATAWADFQHRTGAVAIHPSDLESMTWRFDHLKGLIESGDEDYKYLNKEIYTTKRMAAELAEARNPYCGRRNQLQRRGYRSALDGSMRYYVLYVPPGWSEEGDRQFGLVVTLHGMNSSPMKAMQDVFGEALDVDGGETKLTRERHPRRVVPTRFFVVAPEGFGNTNYRALGEVDVMAVLERVRSRYRIDPQRIYVTGASMGGTGAGSLPLHFPDLFAASAPLCGYHSLWASRRVHGAKLYPFEATMADYHSNVSWATNGGAVQWKLVHGLQDGPRYSNVFVNRLRELGYKVAYDRPDLGHNVWDTTYRDRQIFKHFSRQRKALSPSRVVFHTGRLRYRKSHWISIDDARDYSSWSKISATIDGGGGVDIAASNVAAFSIDNPPLNSGARMLSVRFRDQAAPVSCALPDQCHFVWETGRWQIGPPARCNGLCKRPGLAGPMDDAFFEPLLFVYGTGGGQGGLNRRLTEKLRRPRRGILADWPVKPDVAVSPEDLQRHSLVLVGTVDSNRLLREIHEELPIRVIDGAVSVDGRRHEGSTVSAAFIHPNPLQPERYVLVYTGVSPEAIFYSDHLTQLLPDYVVYDASGWGKKGGRVLGDREILKAGFFNKNWLP